MNNTKLLSGLTKALVTFAVTVSSLSLVEGKTVIDCPTVYQTLFAHSEEAMRSLEKGTTFFYWGRARVAIEATSNQDLEKIFSNMSKTDLEDLYWAVKSGAAKANPKEEKMIEELWHMVDDLGEKPFWGATPDRGYAIREAIRAHDAKLSYSGDPAFAAQLTDQALGKTEVETLSRALAEHQKNAKYPNSKWYDRLVRFFKPHYSRVVTILETDNSIRRQLQKMYEMDKPALEAIPKFKDKLKLTDGELKELQAQASDTAGQLAEAREMIKELYGREVSVDKPLPAQEIRIRDLAVKAKKSGTEQKEAALGATAESDMDTIDRVVGGAWNRENKTTTGMPVAEKNDVHLQIRNPQYRRETPERRAAYLGVTEKRAPQKAEYNVRTEWTVTVEHAEPKTRQATRTVKNSDGDDVTETYTEHYTDYYSTTYGMSRTDVLQARYEEILANGVQPRTHLSDLPALPPAETRGAYAVSASNGSADITWHDSARTDWILQQGGAARKTETPYRNEIAKATQLVDGITNGSYKAALKQPGETKKMVAALENQEKSLGAAREQLASYQKTDAGAIQSQWSLDKEKDFRDRNQQMLTRFDHMITRVVHLAEQVRRESPSLVIEYTLPTYEPQLAQLKAIADKNKKIIVTTSVAAGSAAAATGAYTYRNEIMGFIQQLTGSVNRRY